MAKKRQCDICGLKAYHEYDKEFGILTTTFDGTVLCPECYISKCENGEMENEL